MLILFRRPSTFLSTVIYPHGEGALDFFFCEIPFSEWNPRKRNFQFSRSVELKALWPSVTAPFGPLTLSALAGWLGSGRAVLGVAIHCLRMQKIQGGLLYFFVALNVLWWNLWFDIFSNKLRIFLYCNCLGVWALGAILADSLCWVHGGWFQVALSPPTSCLRSRC